MSRSNDHVETEVYRDYVVVIDCDEASGSFNPRDDESNVGKILFGSNRHHSSPDKYDERRSPCEAALIEVLGYDRFAEIEELQRNIECAIGVDEREHPLTNEKRYARCDRYIKRKLWAEFKRAGGLLYNVYAYIHSGTALSMSKFSDPWDSGQIGITYTTMERAKKILGDDTTEEKIREALELELKIYNQWMEGEVYCWSVQEQDEDGEPSGICLDSCGGYYETADAITEAKSSIDSRIAYDEKLKREEEESSLLAIAEALVNG